MGKGSRNRTYRVGSLYSEESGLNKEDWLAKAKELTDQMASHPVKQAIARWDELKLVLSSLQTNSVELIKCLELPNIEKSLRWEIVGNIDQTGMAEAYFEEIFRLLHNYLASVATLIDHTRKMVSVNYSDKPMSYEYEFKVTEMRKSGVGPTLKGLRNYLLHSAVPQIALKLNDHTDGSFSVDISSASLLSNKKAFDSYAKSYLKTRDNIVILQCVREYQKEIDQLYKWLFSYFDTFHGKEIRDFNKLVKEHRSMMTPPAGLDWSSFDGPTNYKKENARKKLISLLRQPRSISTKVSH